MNIKEINSSQENVMVPASPGLSRSEQNQSIDNVLIINGEVVMNGLIRPQTTQQ
jgi:hypothetical protein